MQMQEEREMRQQQLNLFMEDETGETILNAFMNGNPPFPQFHGEYNPEASELWIQDIKKILVVIHCRNDRKVTHASFMLVGGT